MSELEEILVRLSRIEELLTSQVTTPQKDWYSVPEAAEILGKAIWTVREWCRLGRINCKKRVSGRGISSEWSISAEEIKRIQNEGLFPRDS